jgi:putative inorganic carbon (HCO3(-)) transporter
LRATGFFFKVLQWTYLYFVFIEFMKEKKHLATFMTVFFISASIVLFNGFFQYFFGKDFIFWEKYTDRLFSCFRQANDFGAYLVLVCPIILSVMLCKDFLSKMKKQEKVILKSFFSIVFLVGYFCLGMTLSRGAWIGFLAALIFLGGVTYYRQKQIIFLSLFIAAFFFLTFSGSLNNLRKVSVFSDDQKGLVTITKEEFFSRNSASNNFFDVIKRINGSDRILYWQQAVRIIKRSPIIGNGVNTYSRIAKENPSGTGGYPHNCYLQMAAEVGVLGLGAFFWVILTLFLLSLRNVQGIKDPFFYVMIIGLLSGLFGFLIHSAFDTNLYSVQLGNLMWVIMGVIVAAQKIATEPSKA